MAGVKRKAVPLVLKIAMLIGHTFSQPSYPNIKFHTENRLRTVSPTPCKCGCYYSLRESEITWWVTRKMFVQVIWEVRLPTPALILSSRNPSEDFPFLKMAFQFVPDFSDFSRLTVEVVVLFPKDCHEGTMVKLCAETE